MIARLLGRPVGEVLALPGIEQAGWSAHLQRYPPGDWLTQALLAQICCLISAAAGGKKARPLDFAPWLRHALESDGESKRRAHDESVANIMQGIAERRGDDDAG